MGTEQFWTPERVSKSNKREAINDALDHEDETVDDLIRERLGGIGSIEWGEQAESEAEEYEQLILTTDLAAQNPESMEEIYGWYAKAMARRGREPLGAGSFLGHFFENISSDPTYAFGDEERGFLLGYTKYGVFIPTHFAPKTLRGGYELIQNLGESELTPAVMAITEDLVKTIIKMPSWRELDLEFLAGFRNELVKKTIVYNSHPNVKRLMLGLVAEYLEESSAYENRE